MWTDPPSDGPDPGDPDPGDDDIFDRVFDEDFVRNAAHTEPSAAERERLARQANLARLLADEHAARENAERLTQRYAPVYGDAFADPANASGARSPSRRGRAFRILAVTVAFAIIGALAIDRIIDAFAVNDTSVASLSPPRADDEPIDPENRRVADQDQRPPNWPSASAEASATPLGAPPAAVADGAAYRFLEVQPDGASPVAYDPCRPIHYVTRPGGPESSDALIAGAIESVSAATGLTFIDDGPTDEGPSDDRAPFQPDRYGDRWAPVLISWSTVEESPELGATETEGGVLDVAGYAGSQALGLGVAGEPAELVYVTGSLTLDADDMARTLSEPDGYAQAQAVVLHELGHLVGLDHVEDPTQLMFPTTQYSVTTFQGGDRAGLAALGAGACFPDV